MKKESKLRSFTLYCPIPKEYISRMSNGNGNGKNVKKTAVRKIITGELHIRANLLLREIIKVMEKE